VLENHHRVGIGDGGQQQSLGVVRGRRLHHLQAGHMRQPRLQALAVLRGRPGAGAGREAHHQRHRYRAAQHVAQLGRLVDDLFHGECREVRELELEHRPHPGQRRPHRNACAAQLGDWRVHYAVLAEPLHQVAGDLECAAVDADVLAHQEHPRVGLQRDCQRLVDRLRVAQLAHAGLGRQRVHHAACV